MWFSWYLGGRVPLNLPEMSIREMVLGDSGETERTLLDADLGGADFRPLRRYLTS